MHHGIVHGRHFQGGSIGANNPPDLKNEARSYFASGAMLQELYLTPSMMTDDSWKRIAEAARWAQAHADTLLDAHWVGGDPDKGEIYGYAAWNAGAATLMLRNPDDRPRAIAIDAATVFELPHAAQSDFALDAPFADQRIKRIELHGREPLNLLIEPFEVLVFSTEVECDS